jgi:mRNA-degrading endonuclease YafQ of YafQ-DinJ toxin-antitoxin module
MYKLIFEKSFSRKAHKLIKLSPMIDIKFSKLLPRLEVNPFDNSLKTHGLSGNLKGRYACCLTADIRIIFKLSNDNIHLLD